MFCAKRQRSSRERGGEVSDDPTMPRRVSHPLMCRCSRVSASGYYGWATRPPSAHAHENARPVARMRDLHIEHDGVKGGATDAGGTARYGRAVWPAPGRPLDAPGRVARPAPAPPLAHQALGDATSRHAPPFGTGLHRHRA